MNPFGNTDSAHIGTDEGTGEDYIYTTWSNVLEHHQICGTSDRDT